ncbi:MAG: metal ABC transporter substrate-binding protein [Armatimonadetes bacterium]|nr:metal ABC transporter substrate-binding protein [Armatimonadota bacterium]
MVNAPYITKIIAHPWHTLLLVWALLLVGGCQPQHRLASDASALAPMQVVATFFPVADFVRQVGGEHVQVRILLPPDSDLHAFAPTVQQMKMLQEADAVFALGLEAEPFLPPLLRALGQGQPRIFQISEGCDTLPADTHHQHAHEHHHEHSHHEHHHHEHEEGETGVDPHVWLSLRNAEHMVRNVAQALGDLDPTHRKEYERNAREVVQELRALQAELRARSRGWKQRKFIATHGAYRYLAEEAGLEQVAVFEPLPGVEPSARWLRRLIDTARREQVRVIFAAPPASSRLVDVVAADLGVPVFLLDPLERVFSESSASYQQRMRKNIEVLDAAMR